MSPWKSRQTQIAHGERGFLYNLVNRKFSKKIKAAQRDSTASKGFALFGSTYYPQDSTWSPEPHRGGGGDAPECSQEYLLRTAG